nr:zinc finger BED domain-containing protein DAYSLEEPER-like [Ipomoea batatas]
MTAAPSSSTLTTSCENARIEETSDEMIDEFVEYCKQDDLDNGKSALDVYLDEPQKDMKMFGDMDILNFWKENRHRFGELSYMACDILSIPITTVASESAFSIGGRVLNKYRNCMLPSNVQALLCARNWISSYEPPDDGDGVEEIVPVPTEFSGEASANGAADSRLLTTLSSLPAADDEHRKPLLRCCGISTPSPPLRTTNGRRESAADDEHRKPLLRCCELSFLSGFSADLRRKQNEIFERRGGPQTPELKTAPPTLQSLDFSPLSSLNPSPLPIPHQTQNHFNVRNIPRKNRRVNLRRRRSHSRNRQSQALQSKSNNDAKELHILLWSSSASPVSEASGLHVFGGADFGANEHSGRSDEAITQSGDFGMKDYAFGKDGEENVGIKALSKLGSTSPENKDSVEISFG